MSRLSTEYRNMGERECEAVGKIWVEGHYRGNVWVHAHCRDRTHEEIDRMSPTEKRKFEAKSPNLKGFWEGTGPDPLEAVSSILRDLDLPYNGGGEDFEYSTSGGNDLSEKEWEKEGGEFSTTVYKNGRTYTLSGSVHREKGKWKAGAEIDEVEVD